MLGLTLASALCSLLSCAKAQASREELWSLYVQEHAFRICRLELSEEHETELDDAQHRHMLHLGLSLSEAAVLYRRAREDFAVSSQRLLCGSAPKLKSGTSRPV